MSREGYLFVAATLGIILSLVLIPTLLKIDDVLLDTRSDLLKCVIERDALEWKVAEYRSMQPLIPGQMPLEAHGCYGVDESQIGSKIIHKSRIDPVHCDEPVGVSDD